jgi:uncharacterized protein YxjI
MDKILLKQATVIIGCKFYVDNHTFTLKSASPLVVLDRFIGSIIGVPFTVNIAESNTNDQLIVKKKLGLIFEKYEAVRGHKTIATIKRGKKMMSPQIDIHSIYGDFTIQSNVMARTFEIEKDGSIVATIKKVTFSLKDAYEISNYSFEDIPLLIGIAFTLDNMFHS